MACEGPDGMDAVTEANREAWEAASRKHIIRPGQAAI
jgi:hypothetical protein